MQIWIISLSMMSVILITPIAILDYCRYTDGEFSIFHILCNLISFNGSVILKQNQIKIKSKYKNNLQYELVNYLSKKLNFIIISQNNELYDYYKSLLVQNALLQTNDYISHTISNHLLIMPVKNTSNIIQNIDINELLKCLSLDVPQNLVNYHIKCFIKPYCRKHFIKIYF